MIQFLPVFTICKRPSYSTIYIEQVQPQNAGFSQRSI